MHELWCNILGTSSLGIAIVYAAMLIWGNKAPDWMKISGVLILIVSGISFVVSILGVIWT